MSSRAQYTPSPGSSIPAQQAITGTAETQILNQILSTPTVPVPLFVAIPPTSFLSGKAWSARISGVIANLGAAATATIRVFVGKSSVIANNTAIGTTGAVAQAASTAPFTIALEDCVYDPTSGKLVGTMRALVNNTIVATAAFSTVVTGINNNNDPVLALSLAATLSVANAGNFVSLTEFEIDW